MRVQPENKMADVKPETLEPDIADGIYVKFQRNPHMFCIERHSGTMLGWVNNLNWRPACMEPEVDTK